MGEAAAEERVARVVVIAGTGCLALATALACRGSRQAQDAFLHADSACSACHAREVETAPNSSHHDLAGLGPSCLFCHDPHPGGGGSEGGPATLRARCEDCHEAVVAEFHLPFRHPLGPGQGCTSCHPPHGVPPPKQRLRQHLRQGACVECHAELAGPYMFEHEGSRNLLCLSCHLPHGSPNRRLLTHADTRMLCFSCHTNLEQSHTQNPGSLFRDCLACHVEVHGSNWSREFFH